MASHDKYQYDSVAPDGFQVILDALREVGHETQQLQFQKLMEAYPYHSDLLMLIVYCVLIHGSKHIQHHKAFFRYETD
jgi:hypothetical protein